MCEETSAASEHLQKISQNIKKIGQLSVFNIIRIDLNQKEKEVTTLIEATSAKFAELVGCPNMEQASACPKINQPKTDTKFFAIKLRLLTRRSDPPVADLLGINSEDDQPTGYMPHQTGAIQTQLNRDDHGNVNELGYVLQLEDQMQSIEENIANVNTIVERLSALVYDQRTAVDSIEDNVQSALTNQEAGTTQLTRAANSRQRARKRCCICSIVLTTVLGIIVLILIIIYAPRSNN
ncbi:hypothetical protein P879_03339 [Paragonimus westermani]|uniref:t-SNARE coiled-coil homology domain-containing protein n=1 Tax=Paragonimus westermani TaxID=34504 RepID=A0A8T0DNF9_9TREM|nr:hypothetical protein P879_03339 [Paragonimus westermani]